MASLDRDKIDGIASIYHTADSFIRCLQGTAQAAPQPAA